MREYLKTQEQKLNKVVCNKCGKQMKVENGLLKEGCFHGEAAFDYFSQKDGVLQQFDLCEECYDEMVKQFVCPVSEQEVSELM